MPILDRGGATYLGTDWTTYVHPESADVICAGTEYPGNIPDHKFEYPRWIIGEHMQTSAQLLFIIIKLPQWIL